MFHRLSVFYTLFQIVSEEHDKKPEVSDYKPNKHLSDVANLPDEMVSLNDITIWVDPLDATQEYTGRYVIAALSLTSLLHDISTNEVTLYFSDISLLLLSRFK